MASSPAPNIGDYIGQELQLFSLAVNWKTYWSSRLRSALHGDVLEVGAGLGGNVPYVITSEVKSYLGLEPDARLCAEFQRQHQAGQLPAIANIKQGTLLSLPADAIFDAILYIDVMEHLEHDREEFARALAHLKPGGRLCILCPAHQFLFSPFDKAIGHYRRYTKSMFSALSTHIPERLEYLDSVGLCASLANKFLLRQSYPTAAQIRFWDGSIVPASRVLDWLTCRSLGKSVLGVWRKP